MSEFLNKDKNLTDENISNLVEHLSFKNMKDNSSIHFKNLSSSNSEPTCILRSGELNQWKENMSAEKIILFDKWAEENIQKFNFESHFYAGAPVIT